MSIFVLIAMQALPNYYGVPPVGQPSVRECQVAYDDLSAYQGRAYGVVLRKEVDYPGGMIEFSDSRYIRNEIEIAARPYLERIRQYATTASGAECRSLQNDGQESINIIIRRVFGKQ